MKMVIMEAALVRGTSRLSKKGTRWTMRIILVARPNPAWARVITQKVWVLSAAWTLQPMSEDSATG